MAVLNSSRRAARRRVLAAFGVAALLGACATVPPEPYTQSFDEHTGATVTTVASPIVYYADAPDLAVNARDYVSVWAFEVKENAVRRLFLACELWSTIDRTRVPGIPGLPQPAQVTLQVDDVAVPLRVAGTELRLVGLDAWPFPEPAHDGGQTVFLRLSRDQMRVLASREGVTALKVTTTDGQSLDFALWRDGRPAIDRMLSDLP